MLTMTIITQVKRHRFYDFHTLALHLSYGLLSNLVLAFSIDTLFRSHFDISAFLYLRYIFLILLPYLLILQKGIGYSAHLSF